MHYNTYRLVEFFPFGNIPAWKAVNVAMDPSLSKMYWYNSYTFQDAEEREITLL